MSKEKQIEEMALDICKSRLVAEEGDYCRKCRNDNNCLYQEIAYGLYNADYRKKNEGEWISVEERLPERCGYYLGCTHKSVIMIAPFFPYTLNDEPQFKYDVTHWMPLPEPPMMKGGAE